MQGFKEFILRGNVVELAVAVIIGAAFKTIVDKFVEGVVNPALAAAVGAPNFDEALSIPLGDGDPIKIGLVITALVNFLLVAFVIYFFLVKPASRALEAMKKEEEAAPAEPPAEQKLLEEIRDLLKK